MKSPLPPNWSAVLDEIQRTLTHSLQLAEARAADMAAPLATTTPVSSDAFAQKMRDLEERAQGMQGPLGELDQALIAEETLTRSHLTSVADLRQRLAQWAGRAIG